MVKFIRKPQFISQQELNHCLSWIIDDLSYNDLKLILKGITCASFNDYKRLIKVYSFNRKRCYKDKEESSKLLKLQVIFDILHELRHNYQCKHTPKKWRLDNMCYISSGKEHDDQWIERDANRFARAFMRVHHKEISKILGVEDIDWNV